MNFCGLGNQVEGMHIVMLDSFLQGVSWVLEVLPRSMILGFPSHPSHNSIIESILEVATCGHLEDSCTHEKMPEPQAPEALKGHCHVATLNPKP